MSRFKNTCEDCPLRTKVDVVRASEVSSWGTSGSNAMLFDGSHRHEVNLTEGGVYDSMTAVAVDRGVKEDIANCDGRELGLLRQRCGAGLATAWRWTEIIGNYRPNISGPEELPALLVDANYRDAMIHFRETTLLIGSERDFSEIDCPDHSGFRNFGIKKLLTTVSGTGAEISSGRAVMLDRTAYNVRNKDLRDIYRIRISQGGPHFAFRSAINPDSELARERILYEGLYEFLFSDEKTIEESESLIKSVEDNAHSYYEELEKQLGQIARRGKWPFRPRRK